MRRWWVGLLTTLPVLGLLLSAVAAGAATPVPVVAPGHALVVDVGGFAARTSVRVQLVGSIAGRAQTRSDRRGHVHVSYRVPTKVGRYRLLVVGAPGGRSGRRPAPPTGPAGDAQIVVVSVPLVIGIPFRVGSSGSTSGGLGIGSGGLHNGGGSSGGGLASTGSDLEFPLALGVLLVLLGLVATRYGRRRARL